jgi:hypothetical protein
MAEVKNNFLGAKMNKDVDDRLLSSNEYREAFNLQINRSENSDTGTLQNVFGNSLIQDYRNIIDPTIECIGTYVDESNNNMYLFLTNNKLSSYIPTAQHSIYVYNTLNGSNIELCTGNFLNFSTLNPVLGVNLIEDLLFWTDNRNQPRRINVTKASANIGYYTLEEQISVAKINPLYTMDLFRQSTLTGAPSGLTGYETSMLDVVSEKLPDGITNNPYYDSTYAGDKIYLQDKYVRFSYRYKFEDGEYSIMAPFTQIVYIPQQDGYFLYDGTTTPIIDNEAETYRSTIVKFMRNKVNNVFLQIQLPGEANQLNSKYKISYIEILYKDSNELTVSVVDSIPVTPVIGSFFNTTATVYSYNYQSKKPFKTLPERDLIRVNDRVPIKAFAQEVVGNRVVYGNYQDKATYTKYLDYNVGCGTKYQFGFTNGSGTSIKEYPNHSVKQNRNYQVGVILCDKFGRESGVILSNSTTQAGSGAFGGGSLYSPYLTSADTISKPPSQWSGNSLKVLFNETISPTSPNTITGWPGLYNGDINSTSYNPLGWYSYKIVVKQTEQDYYNVYLPGVMASYPNDPTLEVGKTSHTVLINDNINKIPRDLTEVGPNQLQFRSSVVLYPRVNNLDLTISPYIKNKMFYPNTSYSITSTIADNNSLFFNGVTTIPSLTTGYYANFYQISSNPLIARISTPNKLGVIPSDVNSPTLVANVINLSVLETKPFESKLDIYWETSSVGLISQLNTAIQEGATSSIKDLVGFVFDLTEAGGNGSLATSNKFRFTDIADATITPASVVLISVQTQDGVDMIDNFEIQIDSPTEFRLKTTTGSYFYYGFNPTVLSQFTFVIRATTSALPAISENFIRNGSLINVAPSITTFPTTTLAPDTGTINVFTFVGNNGSTSSGPNRTVGLTWTVTGSSQFTMDGPILKAINASSEGTYNLVVRMTEASGLYSEKNVTVTYPIIDSVTFTTATSFNNSVYFNGTLTIKGAPIKLGVKSTLISSSGFVETSIYINGISKTIRATIPGTVYSPLPNITLTEGVYLYSITTAISTGATGTAEIFYIY